MIINTPNKTDFEKVSKENLTQAFNLLFQVYEDYIDHDDEVIKKEVTIDNIWQHHYGTIRTALILLHQAIEGLMKSIICETSPLLLIDKPRKDWPSLPDAEDKDFNSLYTISGDALLTTFCAVRPSIKVDNNLMIFIDEIRQKRNQAIHGIDIKDISAKYIVVSILNTFTIWFGKDIWHWEMRQNLFKNPLFGYFDCNYESAISNKFLDFALYMVGHKVLAKYISSNILGRAYFCPECKHEIESEEGTLTSKWAFLNPNQPKSNKISCVNCNRIYEVQREPCKVSSCKGNVLYEDRHNIHGLVCLTCFEINEEYGFR